MECPVLASKDIFILTCSHCPFHTLAVSKLVNHYKRAHADVNSPLSLYQCQHCQIVSNSSSILLEHTSVAHPNKEASVVCLYQNTIESSKSADEMGYKCLLCAFKSTEPKNLSLHYFAFHGVKNVSVSPASRTAKVSPQLTHNESQPASSSTAASASADSFIDLSGDDETTSEPCHSTSFESLSALDPTITLQQLRKAVAEGKSPELSLPYRCHHCGNMYSKRKYFSEHVSSCSKSLQLICPCGRVCKWRSNFYAHRKSCPIYNQLTPGGLSSLTGRHRGGRAMRHPRHPTMAFSSSGQLIGVTTDSAAHRSMIKGMNTQSQHPEGSLLKSLSEFNDQRCDPLSSSTAGYTPSDASLAATNFVAASVANAQHQLFGLPSSAVDLNQQANGICVKQELADSIGVTPVGMVSAIPQAIENLTTLFSCQSSGGHYLTSNSTSLVPVNAPVSLPNNLLSSQAQVPANPSTISSDILFPGMLPEPRPNAPLPNARSTPVCSI